MTAPQKWTREWVVRRLCYETRRVLDRNDKTTKEAYVNEGRVRELMDMLEARS